MKKHLKYLRYVIVHKWFVLLACFRLAWKYHEPLLVWRGIIHDWSKFLPSEWFPYVEKFYGDIPEGMTLQDHMLRRHRFDYAWLSHQHRNSHHWQHWILRNDDGTRRPLVMPDLDMLEMLADWEGAGRAITGKAGTTPQWYVKNRERIILEGANRAFVERHLGYGDDSCPF